MKAKDYIYLLEAWLHLIAIDLIFSQDVPCDSNLVTGPLGVEDDALTGPLPHHEKERHHPKYARLSAPDFYAYIGDYLEVRLRKPSRITGFKIQGRPGSGQYVMEYMVLYSDNGAVWQNIEYNGRAQIFTGNSDDQNISESNISSPITASYIRVIQTLFKGHPAFRLEILGCPLPQEGRQTCWKASYVTGIPSWDMFSTTKSNIGDCGKECHRQEACYAFTLNQGSGQCQGHSYTNYVNANIQHITTSISGESNASLLFLKHGDCL